MFSSYYQRSMTDICVDISKLPTISDTNSWDTFVNRIEQNYTDWSVSLRACWRDYRNWIIFGLSLLIIGIIIAIVIVLQSSPPAYPCLMYDSDTLASTVSIDCLQFIWNANCRTKQPYVFSNDYHGWWKKSPQGLSMISCHMSPTACGVGSYGNIIVYMQFCQIKYNQ